MSESLKIKAAALAAAIFLGGIAVVGVNARSSGDKTAAEAARLKPEVIHKRKVKTVRLPSVVSAAPPASATIPVSAPASAPAPVSSRTSPGGSASGGDDEGEHENERAEHKGGGEDD